MSQPNPRKNSGAQTNSPNSTRNDGTTTDYPVSYTSNDPTQYQQFEDGPGQETRDGGNSANLEGNEYMDDRESPSGQPTGSTVRDMEKFEGGKMKTSSATAQQTMNTPRKISQGTGGERLTNTDDNRRGIRGEASSSEMIGGYQNAESDRTSRPEQEMRGEGGNSNYNTGNTTNSPSGTSSEMRQDNNPMYDFQQSNSGAQTSLNDNQQASNGFQQPPYDNQQSYDGFQQTTYDNQQSLDGFQQPPNDIQQSLDGFQQPTYDNQQSLNGFQQPPYDNQQSFDGIQQSPYDNQQYSNGMQQPYNDMQNSSNGVQQSLNDFQQLSNGMQQSSYGIQQFPSYNQQSIMYGDQQSSINEYQQSNQQYPPSGMQLSVGTGTDTRTGVTIQGTGTTGSSWQSPRGNFEGSFFTGNTQSQMGSQSVQTYRNTRRSQQGNTQKSYTTGFGASNSNYPGQVDSVWQRGTNNVTSSYASSLSCRCCDNPYTGGSVRFKKRTPRKNFNYDDPLNKRCPCGCCGERVAPNICGINFTRWRMDELDPEDCPLMVQGHATDQFFPSLTCIQNRRPMHTITSRLFQEDPKCFNPPPVPEICFGGQTCKKQRYPCGKRGTCCKETCRRC